MDRAEFDFLRPSCSWHWVQSSLRVDHPFPVPWQKIHKIQWLRAHAVCKCFQLILSICSEHLLKAHLVANASAGSAGHGGAPLAAVVVVIILLWLFLSSCSCSCSCSCCCCCCSSSSSSSSSSASSASSIFLLSQTPKLHPISSFFLERTSTKHVICYVLLTFQPQISIFVVFCIVPAKTTGIYFKLNMPKHCYLQRVCAFCPKRLYLDHSWATFLGGKFAAPYG